MVWILGQWSRLKDKAKETWGGTPVYDLEVSRASGIRSWAKSGRFTVSPKTTPGAQ
jgi:hypothetical protein